MITVVVSVAFDLSQVGRPLDEVAVTRLAEAVVDQPDFERLGAEDERTGPRLHHIVAAQRQPHLVILQPIFEHLLRVGYQLAVNCQHEFVADWWWPSSLLQATLRRPQKQDEGSQQRLFETLQGSLRIVFKDFACISDGFFIKGKCQTIPQHLIEC